MAQAKNRMVHDRKRDDELEQEQQMRVYVCLHPVQDFIKLAGEKKCARSKCKNGFENEIKKFELIFYSDPINQS